MNKVTRVMATSAVSGLLMALIPQAAQGAASPSVRGKATTVEYSISVNARQTGPGTTAVGSFKILDAGYDVTVDEMVLPAAGSSVYCVSGVNASGGRANLYVNDVGNGRTSYDEVTYQSGPDETCADAAIFGYETVTSGNFRTNS